MDSPDDNSNIKRLNLGLERNVPDFGYVRPTNPRAREYVSIIMDLDLMKDSPQCFSVLYGLSPVPQDRRIAIAGVLMWDPGTGFVGSPIHAFTKPLISKEQEASWKAAIVIGMKILIGDVEEWQYSPLLMHLFIYKYAE